MKVELFKSKVLQMCYIIQNDDREKFPEHLRYSAIVSYFLPKYAITVIG